MINEIQKKLLEIEAGLFQKLCEAFLTEKGHKVHSFGSSVGNNKTRKGKPDLYIKKGNKYIFIECTTSSSNKSKKLQEDLKDCFQIKKTGVESNRIIKVILIFTFNLSPRDNDTLNEIATINNSKLELIDISVLANELCWIYPHLSKEFLGIQHDTNQILRPSQFINEYSRNKLTTGFDNEFINRETEFKDGIEKLKTSSILIIKGTAGSGKTRFALYLQEQYVRINQDYEAFVILNRGIADIYHDSKLYFKSGHKYLIIIDDANRNIPHLNVLLSTLNNTNIEVKIIITVRDYAYKKIWDIIKEFKLVSEIIIQNFNYNDIEKLLRTFKLRFEAYIKINQITLGNPRLAIMCAKHALNTNSIFSLNNVLDIFDTYYTTILNDISEKKRTKILKVMGLLSYFRTLDKSNEDIFLKINSVYNIDKTTLWDTLYELHHLELVDMYENSYAKISDQVFQNYVFYKVFFEKELLDYGLLLSNFSNDFKYEELIKDSLYPATSNFDFIKIQNILDKHINNWEERNVINDDNKLRIFRIFWFVNPLNTLISINNYIKSLPDGKISNINYNLKIEIYGKIKYQIITDDYFNILKLFKQSSEYFVISLDSIFLYLTKKPELYDNIIKYFNEETIYDKNSAIEDYYYQNELFNYLIRCATHNGLLFNNIILSIANSYLVTTKYVSWTSDNRQVTMANIPLRLNESMKLLRKNIFEYIFTIYESDKDKVLKFITQYIHPSEYELIGEIYHYDSQFVIPFMEKFLDPNSFQHCKIVNEYVSFLENRIKLKDASYLKDIFSNDIYRVYRLLRWDERRELKMGVEKFRLYLHNKFKMEFVGYGINEYKQLFNWFAEITKFCENNIEYQIKESIQIILSNIITEDKNIFLKLLHNIISNSNKIGINIYESNSQVYHYGGEFISRYYKIIKKGDYEHKYGWLINFFCNMPESYINEYYINEYYSVIKNKKFQYVCLTDFTYLNRYYKYDINIFSNTFNCLLERTKEKGFKVDFRYLLYHIEDDSITNNFLYNNLEILKRIYLYQVSTDPTDYNKKVLSVIISKDENFIIDYIESRFRDKEFVSSHDEFGNFKVLWEFDNYIGIFDKALEYCRTKTKYDQIRDYKIGFFKGVPFEGKVELFIKNYIGININNLKKLNFIFSIVVEVYPEKRLELIRYIFEKVDCNYNGLEKMQLDSIFYSGSNMINLYEQRKRFWEELKSILIEFNQQKSLLFVQAKILLFDKEIKRELKNNFLNEY
ncbi:MAG: hypothetical protein WC644_01200 [Ignavibacteria bacterium]